MHNPRTLEHHSGDSISGYHCRACHATRHHINHAGRTDEAKTILNELKKRPKLDSMAIIPLADTYSVLGEKDEAFEFLDEAYQQRVSLLVFLGVRPTFDNIRTDPHYADLLRRMGLPQAPFSKPS